MSDEQTERALRDLVEEARRDGLPDVRWDDVEAALLARVNKEDGAARSARPSGMRTSWVLALAAIALVAVAALIGVARMRASVPSDKIARETTTPAPAVLGERTLDGSSLTVGAVLTAGADPLTIDHPGHATWTLEPNAAAHIESVGDVITVALDRGALSAHVVKSLRPESFVVRVDRTRVAVHGTAFRVERREAQVRIDVSEGVVGVGPVGGTAFELPAPSGATVTLDGVRTELSGNALRSQAPESAVAAEDHAKVMPSESATPATDSAASSVDRVIQTVQRCLTDHTVSGGDLRVTVRTRMSLRVQPNGKITEAVFDPPLAPAVRTCVDTDVGELAFPGSSRGFVVDRMLELDR